MPDNSPKFTASTHKEAENAKPDSKLYRLSFGDGLHLEVRPNGKKFWIYRYRNPQTRKPTVLTFGQFPSITMNHAKGLLSNAKEMLLQGIDPNTHKQ